MGRRSRKLRVTIHSAHDIASEHSWIRHRTTNAFVIVCVDDDTLQPLASTRVVHNSLDPTWDETFILNISKAVATRKSLPTYLSFCLSDEGTFGARELGVARVPFKDIMQKETVQGTFPLRGPNAKGTLHLKIVGGGDQSRSHAPGVSTESIDNPGSSSGNLSAPGVSPSQSSVASAMADLASMSLGRFEKNATSNQTPSPQPAGQGIITGHGIDWRRSHVQSPTMDNSWWGSHSDSDRDGSGTGSTDSSDQVGEGSRQSGVSDENRYDANSLTHSSSGSSRSSASRVIGSAPSHSTSSRRQSDQDVARDDNGVSSSGDDDRSDLHSGPDFGDDATGYSTGNDGWNSPDFDSQSFSGGSFSSDT